LDELGSSSSSSSSTSNSSSSSSAPCVPQWTEEAIGEPGAEVDELLFNTVQVGTWDGVDERMESGDAGGGARSIDLQNYSGSCGYPPKIKIVIGLIDNAGGNTIDLISLRDNFGITLVYNGGGDVELTNQPISGGIETDNTFIFDDINYEGGEGEEPFGSILIYDQDNNTYIKSLEVWDDCGPCGGGGPPV
jgi:hypothetical protein